MTKAKVVHINKENYDVYIARPSKWGNPYTHLKNNDTLAKYVVPTRKEAIEKYRDYILFGDGTHLLKDLHELKGKTLGCWCGHFELKDRHKLHCHGQILLELLDKYYPETNKFF